MPGRYCRESCFCASVHDRESKTRNSFSSPARRPDVFNAERTCSFTAWISFHVGATNSADLNGNFFRVLDSVNIVLKKYEKTLIEVAGHTDNVGSDADNQSLSERRANTVAQYLEAHGLRSDRVITVGAGETRPVATNDTPEGRQANRRVELTLTPLTQTPG